MDTGAASDASQEAIDLKTRRHLLREELRTCRTQTHEQRQLAESLEHRVQSAKDVLRLKRDGIGRLESVECPTCHRSLDTASFALTTQSATSVATHVDALERDRLLVVANVYSAEAQTTRLAAELARVEEQLNASERALANVNVASGAVREQLTKAAMDLASVERQIEKNTMLASELQEIQKAIDAWIVDANALAEPKEITLASSQYKFAFEKNLRVLLVALGHNDVTPASASDVRLDELYIPYLGRRRLRSLESASDHSRLVAAYVLALAETSRELHAPHPGFVILDEPLQQNPDPKHRDLFISFLEGVAAKNLQYQTIVFTSLTDGELLRLKKAGVHLVIPEDRHFLRRLETEH